jgi:hypothetical protein
LAWPSCWNSHVYSGFWEALYRLAGRDEVFPAALAARDRAMLLRGFGAALRRSELVAITRK